MKRIIALLLAGLGIAVFCAAQTQQDTESDFFRQEGIASWYGPEFDGRPTASGEIFNSSLLTAAHPSLPFGTQLRITNKHNNKQVLVRVNDRGPFVSARIIDLSKAAAEQLDMITTGTAPVVVEGINPPALAAEPAPQGSGGDRIVSLGPVEPVNPPSTVNPPVDTLAYISAPVISQELVPPPASASPVPSVQPATQPSIQPSVPSTGSPAVQPAPPLMPPSAPPASVVSPAVQSAPVTAYNSLPAEIKGGIPPAGTGKLYRLQVGAYKVARNAVDAFDRLKEGGLNPAYERNGEFYRVVLAGIRAEEVSFIAEKLGAAGFREVLIREEP